MLEVAPDNLMVDRSLRVAGVLLYHDEGQLNGCYCDRKEVALYTNLHPASLPSAGGLRISRISKEEHDFAVSSTSTALEGLKDVMPKSERTWEPEAS